jgi:hypothetical protein
MLQQTREWYTPFVRFTTCYRLACCSSVLFGRYKQMKKARQRAGTKETKKRNARETKEASQQWASLEEVRNVRAPFILCCCWLDGLLFVVGCRHRSHSCARNGEAGQQRVCTAHFCGHGRHISSIRRCAHLAQGKSCLHFGLCIGFVFFLQHDRANRAAKRCTPTCASSSGTVCRGTPKAAK